MTSHRKHIYTRRAALGLLVSAGAGLGATYALTRDHTVQASPTRPDGKRYFVKAGAPSTNDGLSPHKPFPTIQQAADLTLPGDTVYIMDGTYVEASNEGAIVITRSGEPGAYITYRAFPGARPVLHVSPNAWNHILVMGASYIHISGLTIEGNSASFTIDEAFANRNPGKPHYNTNGIFVRNDRASGKNPHHIVVENNVVHHCPGGGIATELADYVTIQKNIVYANAWTSVYANSGISLWKSDNSDMETGYKNFILQNIAFDNESYIPWVANGKISDGNGIIVDYTNQTDIGGAAYVGRTYVANNLSFNNGGTGIHAYHSEHVDIVNNTAFNNARSPALNWSSVYASSCNDVNLLNNVVYVRSGKPTNETYENTNVTYDYNIYYNGLTPNAMGPNDLITDPLLVNPSDDLNVANFAPQFRSPALNSGTLHLAPPIDLVGRHRPRGKGVDRGAYEGWWTGKLIR